MNVISNRSRNLLCSFLSLFILSLAFTSTGQSVKSKKSVIKKNQSSTAKPTDRASFTDPRDGQEYKIVTIGTQTWMAQNLNYTTGNSWCYDNNAANCATYGRLYDWETAKEACPSGWHLPTDAEWTTLTTFLGGSNVAGGKMKSVTGWNAPNTGATNQSGFSALPGGSCDRIDGNDVFCYLIRTNGYWWSAAEGNTVLAWLRGLEHDEKWIASGKHGKGNGLSVRCIKD